MYRKLCLPTHAFPDGKKCDGTSTIDNPSISSLDSDSSSKYMSMESTEFCNENCFTSSRLN